MPKGIYEHKKGFKHSEESKKKMSKISSIRFKLLWQNPEFRAKTMKAQKGHIPWSKGKKIWLNKEHPRGMLGKIAWNKGRKGVYSKEALEKMSKAHLGSVSWNKGKHTGIIPRSAFKKGKDHPMWKGGEVIDGHGYVDIFRPNHPFCRPTGYIRKQRVVMEEFLGRYLKPEEVVHHINKNKLDNRPENLELFSNESKHQSIHAQERNKFRNNLGQFVKVS